MSKVYHLHTGKKVESIEAVANELEVSVEEAKKLVKSGLIGVIDKP